MRRKKKQFIHKESTMIRGEEEKKSMLIIVKRYLFNITTNKFRIQTKKRELREDKNINEKKLYKTITYEYDEITS